MPTPATYTLSLHDALPIYRHRDPPATPRTGSHTGSTVLHPLRFRDAERVPRCVRRDGGYAARMSDYSRSEEHTSELQSPCNLLCRLLLEKKNYKHDTR